MTADYRTVPFTRFGAFVVEWNPDDHNGEREPWEQMEATLDAGWADQLAANGIQATADVPVTIRETDHATDRRRVVRYAWVLPTEVPAKLAKRCMCSVLNGYLTYDPGDVL